MGGRRRTTMMMTMTRREKIRNGNSMGTL